MRGSARVPGWWVGHGSLSLFLHRSHRLLSMTLPLWSPHLDTRALHTPDSSRLLSSRTLLPAAYRDLGELIFQSTAGGVFCEVSVEGGKKKSCSEPSELRALLRDVRFPARWSSGYD